LRKELVIGLLAIVISSVLAGFGGISVFGGCSYPLWFSALIIVFPLILMLGATALVFGAGGSLGGQTFGHFVPASIPRFQNRFTGIYSQVIGITLGFDNFILHYLFYSAPYVVAPVAFLIARNRLGVIPGTFVIGEIIAIGSSVLFSVYLNMGC